MPPKVRQRGKKPSKLRKLQQEQEEEQQEKQPVASTSSSSSNQISTQADFIAFDDSSAPSATARQAEDGGEDGQPNWVKLGDRPSKAEHEAPFGYVDAELKAYLRAGWERVLELEGEGYAAKSTLTALAAAASNGHAAASTSADGAEDDELALLLQATLKEMDGKELILSTDPDTSLIVEAILHRLPAKPLRVFVDRLAGHFAVLAKHRFASHVVQACLATLQPAVTLEHATLQHFHSATSNGAAASSAAYTSDTATIVNEDGILRSATQLILDIAEELSADQELLAGLVTDSFGSHVLRSLLCVLTGRNIQIDSGSSTHAAAAADLRSRRSAKFRTRKAPKTPSSQLSSEELLVVIPDLLYNRSTTLRQEILQDADTDVVRRWATDPVASPLLQLLIEAEADSLPFDAGHNAQSWKGSLADTLLGSFITSPPPAEESSTKDVYVETSLRDSVASHALQLCLERAPPSTAALFFSIYIRNRMAKLCIHPAANHVVASLIRRLSPSDLRNTIEEMSKIATGMVKEQMVGCLQAVVDRVVEVVSSGDSVDDEGKRELVKQVSEVVLAAFRLKGKEGEGLKLLVPAVLALKTRKAYLHTFGAHLKKANEKEDGKGGKKRGRDGKAKPKKKSKYVLQKEAAAAAKDEEEEEPWTMESSYELPPSESTIQGSLLLQSLLRLPGPAAPPHAPPKRTFGRPAPPAAPAPPTESYGCALVLDSLLALPTLTPFATNPTAVHILISALTPPPTSPSPLLDHTQATRRRQLSSTLTNSLPSYCGDKYGSRLADALWFSVDGYSKEKIVKLMIEHSTEILKTPYASYFTNKLGLQLYRKGKIREWNQAISEQKPPAKVELGRTEGGERRHKAVVVETQRPEKKEGRKGKKNKLDGELEAILGQI